MDQVPNIELPVIPPDKKRAYTLFLSVMQAAVIHIAFALTALASFAFGHMAPVAMGFITLVIGTLVVLIDFARRSSYIFSMIVLALAILITAANVA